MEQELITEGGKINASVSNEGWFISFTDRSNDHQYEIQRDDEKGFFEDDAAVHRRVAELALDGSIPHLSAIRFIQANSPKEMEILKRTIGDYKMNKIENMLMKY